MDHQIAAVVRQFQGNRSPDAVRRASHQGYITLQINLHDLLIFPGMFAHSP
jgi:hypothetical protein